MFNIFEKIKELIKKMTGTGKSIERVLNIRPTVSNEMANAIDLWGKMYEDKAPWLQKGTYSDPVSIVSLGLPAFIASEKARMATIEMKSVISAPPETDPETGAATPVANKRAEFLNEQYQKKVIQNIRTQLEYCIAKGGMVIKPYYTPYKNGENQDHAGEFEFDFIQADYFYPLAFNASGKITEAAFTQRKVDKENTYTRFEHHKLEGNKVVIRNKAFKAINSGNANNENELGQEIPLASVPEWAELQPVTEIRNVDRMLFVYMKMPEANTVDTGSPLGVSAYSRAVDQIREADKQYSRMLWEYEGGELAIDIDRDALMDSTDREGNIVSVRPIMQQRLFRQVDLGESDTYKVFNPPLRDVSIINGLNSILMRIEDICALARGTLADVSAEARTATELKILKQRTYASVTEIQTKTLQPALEDLVYVLNVYCTLYNIVGDAPKNPETGVVNGAGIGKYEVSFEWDDSTITDADTELNKRIVLMQNGLTSKLETRMWYFGETEQQAKEALKKIDEEAAEAGKMMVEYDAE